MLDNISGNTGTRGAGLLILNNEIFSILMDSKWAIIFLIMLIIADFWYGRRDSSIRYDIAKQQNDKRRMDLYRWRTSRAVRRTSNKFVDYVILISICYALGMSIFEPIGISHIFGGVLGSLIAFFCEIKSISGHFLFIKGVKLEKKTFMGFVKAFVVAFTKSKNEDIGNALEKGFEGIDNKT